MNISFILSFFNLIRICWVFNSNTTVLFSFFSIKVPSITKVIMMMMIIIIIVIIIIMIMIRVILI